MFRYLLVCLLVGAKGYRETGLSVDPEVHPNVGLLPDACGSSQKGGTEGLAAGLYEFPWMALISYRTHRGLDFLCTGTIINSRYILTAANCVQNKKIAGVRVGEYNKCTSTDCQLEQCESHIQDLLVEEATVHEDFTTKPDILVDNNIALLRLKHPIDLTFKNVAPICLPVSQTLRTISFDNETATVASWKLRGAKPCELNKVNLPLVTREECLKKYETDSKVLKISVNQICADEKAKDACGFASGDPLMLETGGKMVQYGVSSHGTLHCESDLPGIYTDVSKYMDWILSNMKQ